MVDPISNFMAELNNSVSVGVLPGKAVAAIQAELIRPVLQALGTTNATDLTSDEAFEIGDFEPEEEPEPEPQPPVVMQVPAVVPEETPEEAPEEIPEALRVVLPNYLDGTIDLATLAENVLAAWAERQQNDG